MTVYQEIFEVIKQRKADYEAGKAQENSYTAYLFDKGVDKICKKVGEEAAANQGLEWSDVEKVLDERNEKIGNLKKFHQVDKNT